MINTLNKFSPLRLCLICIIASVFIAELIVSVMGLLLKGEITGDYLLTGLVTALFTGSLIVGLLIYLQKEQSLSKINLAQSEQKYRALFESSRDAITTVGEHGLFTHANPAAIAMFGCRNEREFLSLSPITASPAFQPDGQGSAARMQDIMARTLEQGSQFFEWQYRRMDGSTFYAEVLTMCAEIDKQTLLQAVVRDISARKQIEQALQEKEQLLTESQRIARIGSWAVELETGLISCSETTYQLLGIDKATFGDTVQAFIDLVHPKDRGLMGQWMRGCVDGNRPEPIDFRVMLPDGSVRYLCGSGGLQYDAMNKPMRMIGITQDISERKQAEENLLLSALVFENCSEGLAITDSQANILTINPAFTRLTGYTAEEVTGKKPSILSSGKQDSVFYQALWRDLNATGHWEGEIWNRHKNGELYAEWLSINTAFNPDGSVQHRVGLFSDITQRKQSEALIWRQANFDPLTTLANRSMFHDRLRLAIHQAKRTGLPVAVMFIDLDHFKQVNDTLGHHRGDDLLKEVAQRLSHCVRAVDLVARLGGDEFAVLISELDDLTTSERCATAILQCLTEPYTLGKEQAYVSASLGIAFYPKDATEISQLLKNADHAMYAAKAGGRNGYCYFAQSMQEAAQSRLQVTTDMRQALSGQQFIVYYQPIISLSHPGIFNAEALIRWQHPTRGFISPDDFIAIAEESGLIVDIGHWVLRTACAQVMAWRAEGRIVSRIAVNISTRQFYAKNFQEMVLDVLQQTGLPAEDLELEITEGMLIHDMEHVLPIMRGLRNAGVRFSEDDFGTGYSSLSYLKSLPVNTVKIDKSFVRDIGVDSSDTALITAIITMAHALNLTVVAEGVETKQQHAFLVQQGCDYFQGYLFAKPMPAEAFSAYLRQTVAKRLWLC